MIYNLWLVAVQVDRKPFSFDKVKLLAEVDKATADKIFETSMKHPHIHVNVLWMCVKHEKQYGVDARTYCYLEDYVW